MYRYITFQNKKWFCININHYLHPLTLFLLAWFQASTEKQLRTALCWVITQRVVVIYYRRFGTSFLSQSQRSRIPEDGTDRFSRNVGEKSKYYSLRNNPEERGSHSFYFPDICLYYFLALWESALSIVIEWDERRFRNKKLGDNVLAKTDTKKMVTQKKRRGMMCCHYAAHSPRIISNPLPSQQ